jgi:NADPH:quinone reductase-like Zn-dependent oxidoreductase
VLRNMKAIQIHQYGGPEVLNLEEIPRPEPAAGELLVRVLAAGVNPVDWKTCAGRGLAKRYGEEHFPLIVGWDVSGIVEEVGSNVTGFEVGDAVFGMPRFPGIAAAYANYVTAPAEEVVFKPDNITHIQAAALPLVSLTAWQALFDAAALEEGQRILIHAAAGGVGHVAVQLAKWKKAFVIGTASKRNAGFLADIGVDHFVDYQSQRFEDVVANVDIVLDTMSGETRERSWGVLKTGGMLVSIQGTPDLETAEQFGVRATSILVYPDGNQMAQIAGLVNCGKVKPHVDAVYPLSEVAQAHDHVIRGHTRGKVVLVMDHES